MTYLNDLIATARPLNCFLAFFAVFIGGIATFGRTGIGSGMSTDALMFLTMGAISAALISAGNFKISRFLFRRQLKRHCLLFLKNRSGLQHPDELTAEFMPAARSFIWIFLISICTN